VRGEVFNGQCHRGRQCYARGQCFVTVRNYPGVVLLRPRGGGGNGAGHVGQTQWAPSSTIVALSFLTGDLAFSTSHRLLLDEKVFVLGWSSTIGPRVPWRYSDVLRSVMFFYSVMRLCFGL
jgi:hypothetical protein